MLIYFFLVIVQRISSCERLSRLLSCVVEPRRYDLRRMCDLKRMDDKETAGNESTINEHP
jgi:hypothetical protein